jgi:hypothetical protein
LTPRRRSAEGGERGLLSNFFEAEDTAHRYVRRQPELSGFPISIPDAIKMGRAVFADLMKDEPDRL